MNTDRYNSVSYFFITGIYDFIVGHLSLQKCNKIHSNVRELMIIRACYRKEEKIFHDHPCSKLPSLKVGGSNL
jgi:hypothetical protein